MTKESKSKPQVQPSESWSEDDLVGLAYEGVGILKALIQLGVEIDVVLQDAEATIRLNDDEESLDFFENGKLTITLGGFVAHGGDKMIKKQKDRIGKTSFTVHVKEEAHQAWKALAVEQKTTVQALTELAMDLVFEKFGKPPMAQSEKTKKKLASVA